MNLDEIKRRNDKTSDFRSKLREDKKKEVKIYIDLSEAPFNPEDEILESMITFEPSEQSFKFTIINPRS